MGTAVDGKTLAETETEMTSAAYGFRVEFKQNMNIRTGSPNFGLGPSPILEKPPLFKFTTRLSMRHLRPHVYHNSLSQKSHCPLTFVIGQ